MDREPVVHRVDLSTGVCVAFVEQGDRSGPTLLLLHAWGESLRCFDRLTPMLPRSMHVLAMDQRGHGHADEPDDGYDIESLGMDVEAFMDALGLSSVVLVGSSSGGYVAQQVAVRSPGRAAGLVLIGSPPSLRGRPAFADEVDGLTDPIDPAWVRSFLATFPRFNEVPDWYLEERVRESTRIPARVWQRSLMGLTTSTPPIETGPISAPTLILWGDRDEILPHEGQVALAARIPGARFRTYEGVGHLVLWEQPERVAVDLVGFVQDITA
jgi:pimeloyl-ACP methyl ester carboxylesterase